MVCWGPFWPYRAPIGALLAPLGSYVTCVEQAARPERGRDDDRGRSSAPRKRAPREESYSDESPF